MNDKKRRALNTFPPVKTNASLKCTLKIPGIFEQLSDRKIATGPQRQPHRIAKNEQPLARFSPRRDVYGIWSMKISRDVVDDVDVVKLFDISTRLVYDVYGYRLGYGILLLDLPSGNLT